MMGGWVGGRTREHTRWSAAACPALPPRCRTVRRSLSSLVPSGPRLLPTSRLASAAAAGDELRLRHPCPRAGSPPWAGIGFVARLDDASEEVAIELRGKEKGQAAIPTDVSTGFVGALCVCSVVCWALGWGTGCAAPICAPAHPPRITLIQSHPSPNTAAVELP
mgnify:CR=1 FL=1